MHIGVAVPFSHYTPVNLIAETARFVEDAGFHSLWVPERVLFFREYESRYPYSEGHRIADSKKERPSGQVGPVSGDGEIIASCARDAGTRRTSTQADATQERSLTPSRPRG